jgi:hypothetical protein
LLDAPGIAAVGAFVKLVAIAIATGAVIDETILSPAALKEQGFGRLASLVVDGQIYAQPLVVTGLEIPGKGTRSVLFVATMRNMVYAFDADGGELSPFWKTFLGSPMPYDRKWVSLSLS